jgi:hypothetical protein
MLNQHSRYFIQRSHGCPKAKVLKLIHDLHEKLAVFFSNREKLEFKDMSSRDEKLNQTAYWADMFGLLNQLNVSLQGHNLFITDSYNKMKSFHMKVDLRLS